VVGHELEEEQRREAIEHRDAIMDIRAILATRSGKRFFHYLFKNLDVGALPEKGLHIDLLNERLGFLKAGQSIFKLTCEADVEVASQILAKVEKERYESVYKKPYAEAGPED
jgi:hypothetical protein